MKKETKIIRILITILVIITFIVGLGLLILIPISLNDARDEAIRNGQVCEGMTEYDDEGYECCVDCHKLGMHYFKYEPITKTTSDCWCLNIPNQETKQIW